MKFQINGSEWEIEEISNAEMIEKTTDLEGFTHGLTEYSEDKIYINKDCPNKRRTLYHELMHCWMYEEGHNQFGDKKFNNEDICEMVACSHEVIEKITEAYFDLI